MEPYTYKSEKGIGTVIPGKLTDAELRKVLEEAMDQFYRDLCREGKEHLINGVHT